MSRSPRPDIVRVERPGESSAHRSSFQQRPQTFRRTVPTRPSRRRVRRIRLERRIAPKVLSGGDQRNRGLLWTRTGSRSAVRWGDYRDGDDLRPRTANRRTSSRRPRHAGVCIGNGLRRGVLSRNAGGWASARAIDFPTRRAGPSIRLIPGLPESIAAPIAAVELRWVEHPIAAQLSAAYVFAAVTLRAR